MALDSEQKIKKAVAVSGTSSDGHQKPIKITLVDSSGNSVQPLVRQAAQADSVAATVGALVTDFNALLAKLRSAGVIAP